MEDELQEVRDNFYVGNFQKALQLCESTRPSSDISQFECDATLARCYLSLQKQDQLKAMMNSDVPGQKAAALFHVITKSPKEDQVAKAKEKLKEHTAEKQDMSSAFLSANVLAMENSFQDACTMTQAHPTLEMKALNVFFLLMCNQAGMAEKALQGMSGVNDDSASFRLAQAAVHLATGNPEEAYLTYCDLSGQFPAEEGEEGGSPLLQTGKAVANMQRGMWTEALEDLQRAYAVAPTDSDILVNMCTIMTHTGKKEEFQKYYAELVKACPTHPYVVKTQSIDTAFARFKASQKA